MKKEKFASESKKSKEPLAEEMHKAGEMMSREEKSQSENREAWLKLLRWSHERVGEFSPKLTKWLDSLDGSLSDDVRTAEKLRWEYEGAISKYYGTDYDSGEEFSFPKELIPKQAAEKKKIEEEFHKKNEEIQRREAASYLKQGLPVIVEEMFLESGRGRSAQYSEAMHGLSAFGAAFGTADKKSESLVFEITEAVKEGNVTVLRAAMELYAARITEWTQQSWLNNDRRLWLDLKEKNHGIVDEDLWRRQGYVFIWSELNEESYQRCWRDRKWIESLASCLRYFIDDKGSGIRGERGSWLELIERGK